MIPGSREQRSRRFVCMAVALGLSVAPAVAQTIRGTITGTVQFGGTFGGPIMKNKAFFFGDYQGLRLDAGRTQTLTVPTALMRQGNFIEINQRIFDPLTGQE